MDCEEVDTKEANKEDASMAQADLPKANTAEAGMAGVNAQDVSMKESWPQPVLDTVVNPGFFSLFGHFPSTGAIVQGWAPQEEGSIAVIQRPTGYNQPPEHMFFMDYFWWCCKCAADYQWSATRQARHSLHFGNCGTCGHNACPSCGIGPTPFPQEMLHTLSGINISKYRLIGVMWLCPDPDCQEFARNSLQDTPRPAGAPQVQNPMLDLSHGDASQTPSWNMYCRGMACRKKPLRDRERLTSESLVVNFLGRILGTWDGRQAVKAGPWAQHLRALQQGHKVPRQFLEVANWQGTDMLHPSVGMDNASPILPAPCPPRIPSPAPPATTSYDPVRDATVGSLEVEGSSSGRKLAWFELPPRCP